MRDPYDAFREQLAEYGLALPDGHQIKVDGKVERYAIASKPNKKNCWYILFDFHLDNGEVVLAGTFGSFATGLQENVSMTVPELTAEEKQRYAKRQDEIAKAAVKAKKEKQQGAADKASKNLESMPSAGPSRYLARKQVAGFGLRYARGAVYVPLRTVVGKVVGMQYIDSVGTKVFYSGTAKQGAYHTIGPDSGSTCHLQDPKRFIVAEGYATAASVYMAYGERITTIVAFDADNLWHVVRELRGAFPDVSILIAGDNDVETVIPKQNVNNPGKT